MRQAARGVEGTGWSRVAVFAGAVVLAAAAGAGAARAQGILTVTPGRTVTTSAGTGTLGYTGDTGAATSATLAAPRGVAYDAAGNLYEADSLNHVVRKVSTTGTITTVAGTGVEGFAGDGGAATSAQLDTPTGVAIDASGNLYIADSHNHRVRKVTAAGVISTLAGTGVAGFAGDGGVATSAQLSLPTGVAVDATGNVYVADTNNHRVREVVVGGTITTFAGDGEELYAGDGGPATAAALDSPTGVAVDASGNVYIADRLNHRIREVSGGTITTLAGSGAASFAGGFSGDGATATTATLAKPSGVSVDAAGNVYVADTDNQRVRQVGGGAIATLSGTGSQGFGGDNAVATGAILNAPKAVAPDAVGNVSIADKLNQRVRAALLPTLTFPVTPVGVASTTQPVTLANTGTAGITVSTITLGTGFAAAAGGSCPALPIALAAGASCTENVEALPVAVGAETGSVVFGGTGVVPQTVLLAGSASQASTSVVLTASPDPSLAGQPVVLTATVTPQGAGTPTQQVAFDLAGVPFVTQTLATGVTVATATTAALPTGPDSITAVYSGDPNYTTSSSPVVTQQVEDFTFTINPQPANPGGSVNQTVIAGHSATFLYTLAPVSGPFNFPIALTITGVPPDATVTFKPQTVTPGATPFVGDIIVQTTASDVLLRHLPGTGGGVVALALLLLPFSGRIRRRARKLRVVSLLGVLLLSVMALGGLTGCGADKGFYGQPQQTYNISVIATATGPNGYTLQHSINFTLTVQ